MPLFSWTRRARPQTYELVDSEERSENDHGDLDVYFPESGETVPRLKTTGRRKRLHIRSRALRLLFFPAVLFVAIFFLALLFTGIRKLFATSDLVAKYAPPKSIKPVVESDRGSLNPRNQKIFISAAIVNEQLVRGAWGRGIRDLVTLLGDENVFLSIFENDSTQGNKDALHELDKILKCNRTVVTTSLPLSEQKHTMMLDGTTAVKRIEYLSYIRNRGLDPILEKPVQDNAKQYSLPRFDRVLFLNDVVFNPRDALKLLFDTNGGDYAAACGLDFSNPFKFYDTFATRDYAGNRMGVPFYPFFTPGASRDAMLAWSSNSKENLVVPVKSCWGGIAAFDAAYFQEKPVVDPKSVDTHRFRASKELFWDASECCLIHADIDQGNRTFVNPAVRVAYDTPTYEWAPFVARFERLFSPFHWMISRIAGQPTFNPRRLEREIGMKDKTTGRVVKDLGGYCGVEMLMVMNEGKKKSGNDWDNNDSDGGKNTRHWRLIPVPEEYKGGKLWDEPASD